MVSSTRRRGRPSSGETKRLERDLLAAATQAFCSKGYHATSMDEIAAAAGTRKKAIYLRFATKESLFHAVVREAYLRGHEFSGSLGPAPANPEPLSAGLRRRAITILEICSAFDAVSISRLQQLEGSSFPELGEVIKEFTTPLLDQLMLYFCDQMRTGAIREIDVPSTVLIFFMAVTSELLARIRYNEPIPTAAESARHAERVADIFANGLTGGSPETSSQTPASLRPSP